MPLKMWFSYAAVSAKYAHSAFNTLDIQDTSQVLANCLPPAVWLPPTPGCSKCPCRGHKWLPDCQALVALYSQRLLCWFLFVSPWSSHLHASRIHFVRVSPNEGFVHQNLSADYVFFLLFLPLPFSLTLLLPLLLETGSHAAQTGIELILLYLPSEYATLGVYHTQFIKSQGSGHCTFEASNTYSGHTPSPLTDFWPV